MKPEQEGITIRQLVSAVLLLVLLLSSIVVGLVMTRFWVKSSLDDLPTTGVVNSTSITSQTQSSFNNGLPTDQARPLDLDLELNVQFPLFMQGVAGDAFTLFGLNAKSVHLGTTLVENVEQMTALKQGILYYTSTSIFYDNTLIWQLGKDRKIIDLYVHGQTNELFVLVVNPASETELHLLTKSGKVNKLYNFGKLKDEMQILTANNAASRVDLRTGNTCFNLNLIVQDAGQIACPVADVKVVNDLAGAKLTWRQRSINVLGTRVIKATPANNDLLIWAESLITRDSRLYLYNYTTQKLQEFTISQSGVIGDVQLKGGLIYVIVDNGNTHQVIYTATSEIWTWLAASSSSASSSSASSSSASSSLSSTSSSSSSSSSTSSSSSASSSSNSSSSSSTSASLPGKGIWVNITPLECYDELGGCQLTFNY